MLGPLGCAVAERMRPSLRSTLFPVPAPASGGSQWVREAPCVLQAANLHQVHLGGVMQIYGVCEALPNLINPFWIQPLPGILKLKDRDVVGYGVLQLIAECRR